jgi:prepilin-type N-terminal cleavage/methylation domain-containing protein
MGIKNHGFTLIELSIVLVIIGLLVGGVIVGRTLIQQAEIRAEISQIEKLDTAVGTFRGKYNCLPGDCGNAVSLGLAAVNGNANGKVDALCELTNGPELQNFWYSLGAAKLTDAYPLGDVPGTNSPPLKMRGQPTSGVGGIWLSYHVLVDGATASSTTIEAGSWLLTASHGGQGVYLGVKTFGIDNKIDDGLPLTGKMSSEWMIGMINMGTIPHTCSYAGTLIIEPEPGDPMCYDLDTELYDLNNTAPGTYGLCLPRIKTNW